MVAKVCWGCFVFGSLLSAIALISFMYRADPFAIRLVFVCPASPWNYREGKPCGAFYPAQHMKTAWFT